MTRRYVDIRLRLDFDAIRVRFRLRLDGYTTVQLRYATVRYVSRYVTRYGTITPTMLRLRPIRIRYDYEYDYEYDTRHYVMPSLKCTASYSDTAILLTNLTEVKLESQKGPEVRDRAQQ